MTNNTVGRPSKYGGIESIVVGKLTEAFKHDFTVEEACHYAGIHKTTYYDWLSKHPEFSDEMERARDFVATEAKKVVKNAILNGDLRTSQWFLERRQRELYQANKTPNFDDLSSKSEKIEIQIVNPNALIGEGK